MTRVNTSAATTPASRTNRATISGDNSTSSSARGVTSFRRTPGTCPSGEQQQQASHATATFAQRFEPGTQQAIQSEVPSWREPEHGDREQHHEDVAPLPLVRGVGEADHQLHGHTDGRQSAQAAEKTQAHAQEDPGLGAPDHVPKPVDVGLHDVLDERRVQLRRPPYRNAQLRPGARPHDLGLQQFIGRVRLLDRVIEKETQTTTREAVPASELGRQLPPERRKEEAPTPEHAPPPRKSARHPNSGGSFHQSCVKKRYPNPMLATAIVSTMRPRSRRDDAQTPSPGSRLSTGVAA